MTSMQRGPVAMFDALGFKGIWKRHSPDGVLAKLERLQREAEKIPTNFGGADPGTSSMLDSVRVTLLSDTVVVALGVKRFENLPPVVQASGRLSQELMDGFAIQFLAKSVAAFIHAAGEDQPVIAYRGTISFGLHSVGERFIVGPAIDDAAEHMDLASGAFVWLTPTAMDAVSSRTPSLLSHRVPLAGGDVITAHVVNPLSHREPSEDHTAWMDGILRSFDAPSARVRVLRDNTEAFLRAARGAI